MIMFAQRRGGAERAKIDAAAAHHFSSHAKTQKRKEDAYLDSFFAPLRLCVRKFVGAVRRIGMTSSASPRLHLNHFQTVQL
jgi:hypothetical protein